MAPRSTCACRAAVCSAAVPFSVVASSTPASASASPASRRRGWQGYALYRNSNSSWATIRDKNADVFRPSRASVDLKDKWRNMQKKA